LYPFGRKAPQGTDEFLKRYGIELSETWEEFLALHASEADRLKEVFDDLDRDRDGLVNADELREFGKRFHDGRAPTDKQVAVVMERLDLDKDGLLSFEDLRKGAQAIASACCPECHKDYSGWL